MFWGAEVTQPEVCLGTDGKVVGASKVCCIGSGIIQNAPVIPYLTIGKWLGYPKQSPTRSGSAHATPSIPLWHIPRHFHWIGDCEGYPKCSRTRNPLKGWGSCSEPRMENATKTQPDWDYVIARGLTENTAQCRFLTLEYTIVWNDKCINFNR